MYHDIVFSKGSELPENFSQVHKNAHLQSGTTSLGRREQQIMRNSREMPFKAARTASVGLGNFNGIRAYSCTKSAKKIRSFYISGFPCFL